MATTNDLNLHTLLRQTVACGFSLMCIYIVSPTNEAKTTEHN